jgi:hypothetical protein
LTTRTLSRLALPPLARRRQIGRQADDKCHLKEQTFGPHHVEVSAVSDGRPRGKRSTSTSPHGYNYFTRVEAPMVFRPEVDVATLRATSYRGPGGLPVPDRMQADARRRLQT